MSPFRPGSGVTLVSTSHRLGFEHPERTVSKVCYRRFLKPAGVARPFDFQLCAGYASAPCPALCQVPPVSPALLPFSFFLSRARRTVRACPGLGPAGPSDGRLPHGAPARPAGGRDRPRSQAVGNALRTGVLGGACAYGRKPRSPQHGAAGRRQAVYGRTHEDVNSAYTFTTSNIACYIIGYITISMLQTRHHFIEKIQSFETYNMLYSAFFVT